MDQGWSDWRARLRWWWKIMFLDMRRHWVCLAVQTIKAPAEKKKRKGKRKAQRYILKKRKSIPWRRTSTRSRNLVRRGLCLVVHRKQRQERLVKRSWWLSEGLFSPLPPRQRRRQGLSPQQRQRKGPKRKRQGRNLSSIQVFTLRNTQRKRIRPCLGMRRLVCQPWDWRFLDFRNWVVLHAWMAVPSLNLAYHPTHVVLDLGCTRSIGSRAAIERLKKHAWYYGTATELGRCNDSFVFANSETETCMESCIIHFPTTPPCSTKVDVLETGDVPILFSPSQMKNLGMTFELDPKRDKITCPAFGLFSSPAKVPQRDILCWTWRVLCISLRLNRAIDLVTHRNM